jgi:hypothetical protein
MCCTPRVEEITNDDNELYATAQLRKKAPEYEVKVVHIKIYRLSTEIQDQRSNAKATPIPAGIFAERAVISWYIKRENRDSWSRGTNTKRAPHRHNVRT